MSILGKVDGLFGNVGSLTAGAGKIMVAILKSIPRMFRETRTSLKYGKNVKLAEARVIFAKSVEGLTAEEIHLRVKNFFAIAWMIFSVSILLLIGAVVFFSVLMAIYALSIGILYVLSIGFRLAILRNRATMPFRIYLRILRKQPKIIIPLGRDKVAADIVKILVERTEAKAIAERIDASAERVALIQKESERVE